MISTTNKYQGETECLILDDNFLENCYNLLMSSRYSELCPAVGKGGSPRN